MTLNGIMAIIRRSRASWFYGRSRSRSPQKNNYSAWSFVICMHCFYAW